MSHPLQTSSTADAPTTGGRRHRAGAFDIRNVIATLLAIYGVVLVVCSAVLDPGVNPETGVAKSSADNLWTGVAMIVVAAGFVLWTRLRPIVVDDAAVAAAETPREGGDHR
ncbi:hypothetical protein [Corynebacterium bovis]|uniref:Uncharacterized protein n=1 Tax=Corynebacterium bovis DSM 20582 = CIP 54.80 TaxID=927655 RepID=A0A8H9Y6A0_9CORY|nr:hypothetical protein [Corynebacterium bovis]MBB3115143.1 hypothetical protein [Corynebacterium bovis DSM 20582 = CIP 54.80]QQC48414.1 hypothetical protein I6I09_02880 [Corynebacterium bovis]RRO80651.1 hypothetical protein CXF38_06040 [Corynebacterium bovis]RRO81581.1 hypothetical protein CXF36_06845 [Corynebacterium bovis]RRO84194.1 hypothetical protein CXF37_03825 [Corynebacterium bovis]